MEEWNSMVYGAHWIHSNPGLNTVIPISVHFITEYVDVNQTGSIHTMLKDYNLYKPMGVLITG